MNDPSQINRRVFLKVAAVASGGWAGLSLPPAHAADKKHPAANKHPAGKVVSLSAGPYLFIDDFLIAESKDIRKVTQHPQRMLDAPILGWKEHTTQPYVTVLRDDETGLFRMWYNYDIGTEAAIAYAESKDGIAWTLPTLNLMGPDNRLFKIGRSPDHGSYGVSVVDDGPGASDPQRRYKLMWWSGTSEPAGASMAFSPDGIRWTPYEDNPVLPFFPFDHPKAAIGVGDIVDLFHDPIRDRYGALLKLHAVEADGWKAGPRAGKAYRRLVGASVSEDAMHWKEPWRVMTPEPRDEGLLEFYSAGGTITRGPLLISFVRMLHDDYSPDTGRAPEGADAPGAEPPAGLGYTTLATSRDGVHWQRHDDIFFDRNPQPGTWDRAMTWVGSAVPVGDELFLYYGGYARGHKVEPTKERQIGLAKMVVDRFVAVESAGEMPGMLLTVPLRLRAGDGSAFLVNADASRGQIRIQVRDAKGDVIPGFSFEDCVPITGDGIDQPVQWLTIVNGEMKPGLIDLVRLDNQTVQLEFEITDASLFAFDVQPGKPRPLRVGEGPHLFIDDHLIADSDNLDRKTTQPQRLDQPIIGTEQHPDGRVSPATMLYDAQRDVFRFWYWSEGEKFKNELRYIESKDPAKWSGQGEVVLGINGDAGKIIVDEAPNVRDPQRRYKLAAFLDQPIQGTGLFFSPDGKNWTPYDGNPVLPYYPFGHPHWRTSASDILDPYWDPIRRQYGMLIKLWSMDDQEFGMNSRTAPADMKLGIRLTGMSVSDDFLHWSEPWRAFVPDHRDDGVPEHYGGHVMARGDLLIAFMLILRDDLGEEGAGYTVLATSRDGRNWDRQREPFLDANPDADFDHVMAWMKTAVVKGDTVYLVYSGRDKGHKTGYRQIGLAWLPRDRYLARQANGKHEGRLLTPLLTYTGGAAQGLWINADGSQGQIIVRVLDVAGNPIPGLEQSQPIQSDGLAVPVQWPQSFSKLGNKPFQLEFVLRDAAIFGFSFTESGAEITRAKK